MYKYLIKVSPVLFGKIFWKIFEFSKYWIENNANKMSIYLTTYLIHFFFFFLTAVVPHLIGPDSCLCTTCFYYIKKHSCIQNHKKNISTCMIIDCEQSVDHMYNVPSVNNMENLLNLKGVCKT